MDFSEQSFSPGDPGPDGWGGHLYEYCRFRNLDLGGTSLAEANFMDCVFVDCNLSNVSLHRTKLNNVRFEACKLTGVDFGACSSFGFQVAFERCGLDLAIFLNQNLKKTSFAECLLKEAHFLHCDLTEALFDRCDLTNARFAESNLTKADFSSSDHLRLNPDDNQLKKTRFSLHNLPGLLEKYDIVIRP